MQKLKLFFFILFLTPVICALFGIIHDHVTCSISEEYYTKFKFIQFGLINKSIPSQLSFREGATIVGIMATWWMGIPIAIMLGGILMFFKNDGSLYRHYVITMTITFAVTVLAAFAGYLYWKIHLQRTTVNWYMPENLLDKESFICVGSIHNFSYMGAVAGLMMAVLYLIIQKGKQTENKKILRFRE
ncbi:MAG TPA: hypothetical protein VGC65_06680 [Bacteroidia bacterium]|jgi:hypothetical protein